MAALAHNTYFQQFLSKKTTLDELIKHVKVNRKWYKFGVLLNLLADELDAIEKLYQDRDASIKALKMFFVWLNPNTNASRQEILETLRKDAIGESAVADDYLKAIKKGELYMSPESQKGKTTV